VLQMVQFLVAAVDHEGLLQPQLPLAAWNAQRQNVSLCEGKHRALTASLLLRQMTGTLEGVGQATTNCYFGKWYLLNLCSRGAQTWQLSQVCLALHSVEAYCQIAPKHWSFEVKNVKRTACRTAKTAAANSSQQAPPVESGAVVQQMVQDHAHLRLHGVSRCRVPFVQFLPQTASNPPMLCYRFEVVERHRESHLNHPFARPARVVYPQPLE